MWLIHIRKPSDRLTEYQKIRQTVLAEKESSCLSFDFYSQGKMGLRSNKLCFFHVYLLLGSKIYD